MTMPPALLQAQSQVAAAPPLPEPLTAVALAKQVGIGVSVLVVLLVAYTILFHRRRLLDPTARWLHLIVLWILPSFLLLLGNFVAYEEAKSVEFCGSCHPVMDPYVEDMRDPKSQTLAAVHYQNRYIREEACYACHVNYGIFGTFQAKMNGLKHVQKFYTATWAQPIKLYQPFPNAICLNCHHAAQKFEQVEVHIPLRADLASDAMSCLACHSPSHAPPAPKG
jgi:nitrate/TMAO reductase-like tetraheme cytochrome c subunit